MFRDKKILKKFLFFKPSPGYPLRDKSIIADVSHGCNKLAVSREKQNGTNFLIHSFL